MNGKVNLEKIFILEMIEILNNENSNNKLKLSGVGVGVECFLYLLRSPALD